jgi:hypothetical protein
MTHLQALIAGCEVIDVEASHDLVVSSIHTGAILQIYTSTPHLAVQVDEVGQGGQHQVRALLVVLQQEYIHGSSSTITCCSSQALCRMLLDRQGREPGAGRDPDARIST